MHKPDTHVLEVTTIGQLRQLLEALPEDTSISSASMIGSVDLVISSHQVKRFRQVGSVLLRHLCGRVGIDEYQSRLYHISFEAGRENTPTDTVESFIKYVKDNHHD